MQFPSSLLIFSSLVALSTAVEINVGGSSCPGVGEISRACREKCGNNPGSMSCYIRPGQNYAIITCSGC
ncbi:hypothetical protein HYFRA_00005753 [Hymenoscyphus fraxineus]|uniref:Uncharacterized protein n=1 Tax=Hymenoscyphus fraxineus TaxID=746836 RepID=A0A9N9KS17_9HELO|nr:hypothetical protein HYFRA_00005753 [Hymenoscyphus fraxineus]